MIGKPKPVGTGVMYVCQLSLVQLLIWAGYKRDCLRLFVVVMLMLLVMYCMYILAFIVTSADTSDNTTYTQQVCKQQ